MNNPSIKLSIKSDAKNVSFVCNTVTDFLRNMNVEKQTRDKIELCLAEALNNIIRHAYKNNPGKLVNIKVEKEGNEIRIILVDYGIPRPENVKPTLCFDPDDIENLPEGGFGLYLIDNLMDENIYRTADGKNVLLLKKYVGMN